MEYGLSCLGSPTLTQATSYILPTLTQATSYSSPTLTLAFSYSPPTLTQVSNYRSLTAVSFCLSTYKVTNSNNAVSFGKRECWCQTWRTTSGQDPVPSLRWCTFPPPRAGLAWMGSPESTWQLSPL